MTPLISLSSGEFFSYSTTSLIKVKNDSGCLRKRKAAVPLKYFYRLSVLLILLRQQVVNESLMSFNIALVVLHLSDSSIVFKQTNMYVFSFFGI